MNTSTDTTPNPELDIKITSMLHKIDAATPPPPALNRLADTVTTPEPQRSNWMTLVAAASIVAVGVGGLALIGARDATPVANQSAPPVTSTDGSVGGRLLYPTATATGQLPQLAVVDLGEGQQAMVQAPDGTLYRVAVSEEWGYVPDPAADRRDVGNHRVVANSDGNSVGYSWTDGCVVTSVTTEDGGPTWAPERTALLESFTVAHGGVGLDLAEGWNVIDQGSSAPLAQLSYAVELDGVTHDVVLGQSIGASIAALGSPAGPMQPVTLIDGTPAWFEPESYPSPRLSFARDGVAIWMWGDGLTADDLVAAASLLAPAPEAWNSLLTEGAEVAPTGTVPAGGATELCGTPTLSIAP